MYCLFIPPCAYSCMFVNCVGSTPLCCYEWELCSKMFDLFNFFFFMFCVIYSLVSKASSSLRCSQAVTVAGLPPVSLAFSIPDLF